MKLNFNEIEEQSLKEFKGGKGTTLGRMHVDANGRIMKATLAPGCSIGMHTHTTSSEIAYIISGVATCYINNEIEVVKAGECHYCPKGSTHSICNEGNDNLVMFCVVPEQ